MNQLEMGGEKDDPRVTYEAVCPECDAVQEIVRTQPWVDDMCSQCGADVPQTE